MLHAQREGPTSRGKGWFQSKFVQISVQIWNMYDQEKSKIWPGNGQENRNHDQEKFFKVATSPVAHQNAQTIYSCTSAQLQLSNLISLTL